MCLQFKNNKVFRFYILLIFILEKDYFQVGSDDGFPDMTSAETDTFFSPE